MIWIVATHHKTGTSYTEKVFAEISNLLAKRLITFGPTNFDSNKIKKNDIILFSHGKYHEIEEINKKFSEIKIIHFIRDPVKLICSATSYHLSGKEDWLHDKSSKFDGQTYFEKINSLTFKNALKFEMENASYWNIKAMLELEKKIDTFPVNLADISHDKSLKTYFNLFSYLGLNGQELFDSIGISIKHALWNLKELPSHSTSGVSEDIPVEFDNELNLELKKMFGSDLELIKSW